MEYKKFEDKKWKFKSQNLTFRIKEAVNLVDRGRVLDLGCGDGLFLQMIKNSDTDGIGVDFSREAAKKKST